MGKRNLHRMMTSSAVRAAARTDRVVCEDRKVDGDRLPGAMRGLLLETDRPSKRTGSERDRPAMDSPRPGADDAGMERRGIAAVAAPFGRDLDEGFARIERTLGEARARGAGTVVFPESTLGGYLREDGAADLLPRRSNPTARSSPASWRWPGTRSSARATPRRCRTVDRPARRSA